MNGEPLVLLLAVVMAVVTAASLRGRKWLTCSSWTA